MGSSYHQFCPVAKAMELLDERWTLLIVRELLSGSERFNDLRRGVPRMSPTLLSKRLGQLVRAGVVERRDDGDASRYLLSPAGQELRPIVEALGIWGVRWIGEIGDEDLDPKLLMWDIHRNIEHAALPDGRTVVEFRFTDAVAGRRAWWLVLTPAEADVCDVDPGFPVALTVSGGLRRMTEIWRGDLSWDQAIRSGQVVVAGPAALRRSLPRWLSPSKFAAVPRPAVSGGSGP